MKRVLSLVCCLLFVAAACAADTEEKIAARKPRIEVCFVLDTTGSMAGLIDGAKEKIWAIANELIAARPTPELRLALVGYRDRSDEYVTRISDLTDDIDAIHAQLMKFSAGGGGDGPESVNQALHEAVTKIGWSGDRDVLKIVFLVGDAPPHMDYDQDVRYPEVCQMAVKRDLVINAVQCGEQADTARVWQEIAKLAEGKYIPLVQTGGMVQIAAPQDDEIARLNRDIGGTLIAYGRAADRNAVHDKQRAAEAAAPAAAADRLAFNATTGRVVQGGGELLDAIERREVDLATLPADELPEELLDKLLAARAEHVAAERRRLVAEGKADAFDAEVAKTVREQAGRKGIEYGK